MRQGTAASAEQPCTAVWTPGQLTQAVAQFVVALGVALLRFEPAKLIPLLQKHGAKLVERLSEAIKAFIAEVSLTFLPLFAASFDGWKVIEDGAPVDEDGSWVEEFFAGMSLSNLRNSRGRELSGEGFVKRVRERMNGRREFDQHILNWLFHHWGDPRIPPWFEEAVESGDVYVVATGTILVRPGGDRCVLYLYWDGSQLVWDCRWLGVEIWRDFARGLIPANSDPTLSVSGS